MTTTEHLKTYPFELGPPQQFRGLALIPLFNTRAPELEYIGLDEASARGLIVTEAGNEGDVNALLVDNPLGENVLLFEGEELAGAKQNRILDRAILVHAESTARIPVSCVERGRWSYRSDRFAPAPHAAHPAARQSRRAGGQGAVWSEIATKSMRLEAFSATEAAEEMYTKRGSTLEEHLAALPRQPGQCGAIVCVAGTVVCLDYVSRSDVYAGLHAKLLRGCALDALERPLDAPVPEAYIEKLLARIGRAPRQPGPRIGLGTHRALRGPRLSGDELTVRDEVVALSVFPVVRA